MNKKQNIIKLLYLYYFFDMQILNDNINIQIINNKQFIHDNKLVFNTNDILQYCLYDKIDYDIDKLYQKYYNLNFYINFITNLNKYKKSNGNYSNYFHIMLF